MQLDALPATCALSALLALGTLACDADDSPSGATTTTTSTISTGAGGASTTSTTSSSTSTSTSTGGAGGGGTTIDASAWTDGALPDPPPTGDALLPLPGSGVGGPVFTSNNPEIFQGNGLLYGTGRASDARGGAKLPLSGGFGAYVHHINDSGSTKVVTLMVTNPGASPITVEAHGSGYNQTETGGLGLGESPDYHVSEEWITDAPSTSVGPTTLMPDKPLAIWQKSANDGAEIDGRFAITTSGPAYVYAVVTDSTDLAEAIAVYQIDAPGVVAVSGDPPPPFGREAGVYAHDTWASAFDVIVPASQRHLGFVVNTASGAGYAQVQAFAALAHYDDSAAESVGMYGNVYDVAITLHHDEADAAPRHVALSFASIQEANLSRYWDGVGLVDGAPIVIRHVPGDKRTVFADVEVPSGQTRSVHLRAMVPGLTSIPQAIYLESL